MKFFNIPTNSSTPADGDFFVAVTSAGVDQKFTLTTLLNWLKAKATWVVASMLDFTTLAWQATVPGTTNTSASGSYAFNAISGLSTTFPAVNGAQYEVAVNCTYFLPGVATESHLQARIGGAAIADCTVTYNAGLFGIGVIARGIYTASSSGNITVTGGVVTGGATTLRTDNLALTVRRVA